MSETVLSEIVFGPSPTIVLLLLGLFRENTKENLKNVKNFPHLANPQTLGKKAENTNKTKEISTKKNTNNKHQVTKEKKDIGMGKIANRQLLVFGERSQLPQAQRTLAIRIRAIVLASELDNYRAISPI